MGCLHSKNANAHSEIQIDIGDSPEIKPNTNSTSNIYISHNKENRQIVKSLFVLRKESRNEVNNDNKFNGQSVILDSIDNIISPVKGYETKDGFLFTENNIVLQEIQNLSTEKHSKFYDENKSNANTRSFNKSTKKTASQSKPERDIKFGEKLLKEINEVRTTPLGYAEKIENCIKYITPNKKNNKSQLSSPYLLLYPGADKIGLPTGELAFKKTVEYLKNINPVGELNWCDDIKIDIPENCEDFNTQLLKEIIINKRNSLGGKYPNFSVNLDVITDPVVSCILQIVDDNAFQGERRKTILDKKFTLFAVSQGKDRKKKVFSLITFA